jgi:GxxExxY protein
MQSFDPARYKHQEITRTILRCFYDVYNELGFGFLESVYEAALAQALRESGLEAKRQFPLPVFFRGEQVGDFRADLTVADSVVVELKAVRVLETVHEAQLLNYLRAFKFEIGLLLNFGPVPRAKRLIFTNDKKRNLCSSVKISG